MDTSRQPCRNFSICRVHTPMTIKRLPPFWARPSNYAVHASAAKLVTTRACTNLFFLPALKKTYLEGQGDLASRLAGSISGVIAGLVG